MPKEKTHWLIAEHLAERIPLGHPLHHLIREHRQLYLIGAVLPDTLLHALVGTDHQKALTAAVHFHAPNHHSYQPLIDLLSMRPLDNGEQALLLGVATHIETDILFHPCIETMAAGDRSEHYRLETLLDLWLTQRYTIQTSTLSSLLSDSSFSITTSLMPHLFHATPRLSTSQCGVYLRLHALLQSWYGSETARACATVLAKLMPSLRDYRQLWYPTKPPDDWPWPAKCHTCHELSCSMPDLLLDRVADRLDLLLERVIQGGLQQAFLAQPGEGLVSGQVPVQQA